MTNSKSIHRDPADVIALDSLAEENAQLRYELADLRADYTLLKVTATRLMQQVVAVNIRERQQQTRHRSAAA